MATTILLISVVHFMVWRTVICIAKDYDLFSVLEVGELASLQAKKAP